ncbi:hypothetical protein A2U01_0032150 [Trifolium medium]|uniref:Uncharacterized protein n=1 Tax=Trifolium medium TaxID=97028 RepID=A0A392PG31_9FABA|nr:hypothetical protein [Trifolium medium]
MKRLQFLAGTPKFRPSFIQLNLLRFGQFFTIEESFLLGDQFGLFLLEGMEKILSCFEAIRDSMHFFQNISLTLSKNG